MEREALRRAEKMRGAFYSDRNVHKEGSKPKPKETTTNDENQHTKQENNFYHIIDKKLNTASNLPGCIKTNRV